VLRLARWSVLLHEYGHALGLDHSVTPNDFMAPNLQPGERRLPSSNELVQLSQLANALSSVGWASAQQVGMNSDLPGSPGNPASPALSVGTALSALLIGRLRRTDYGSTVPVFTVTRTGVEVVVAFSASVATAVRLYVPSGTSYRYTYFDSV
jgi:hypothetical protein